MKKKTLSEAVTRAFAGATEAQRLTTASPTSVRSSVPMRLFKYLKRGHANDLLQRGIIRIGTLYDFRRGEHVRGVSDPSEGTKLVQQTVENMTVTGEDFFRFSGQRVRSVNISGPPVTFQRNFDSEDFFVLCLSSESSKAVMAQFEGADTCLEISNVSAFLHELETTLSAVTPVVFEVLRECCYTARVEQWNGYDFGLHPAIMKEPEFATQKEVRAIWRPSVPGTLSPVIIRSPKLTGLCKDVTHKLK